MSKVIHKFHNNLNQFSHSLLHRGQKSKDPYNNKRLSLSSVGLLLKTLGTDKLSTRCSSTFSGYINNSKNIRIAGFSSAFILLILSALSVYPIVRSLNSAEAVTPTNSTTSLSITSTNSASVELLVKSDSGTFASSTSSQELNFNVKTDNYAGYELTLLGKDSTYNELKNSSTNTTLTSISGSKESSEFSNGNWGYTLDGTNYRAAPDNKTGYQIEKTSIPNKDTAKTYTLGIGAKANYSTKAGTYTNTYVLTAVGNSTPYTIYYKDNTNDSSVANLPTTQDEATSAININLSDTIPTRTGYTFSKWCDGTVTENGTKCSGTQYSASASFGIDRTAASNVTTLYAVWTVNSYTLNITNNNTTSNPATSTTINFGGETTITVTPNAGFYLSEVSCPTGYTCSGYTTGSDATGAQTVTVKNNGDSVSATGGTVEFTAVSAVDGYLQDFTAAECSAMTTGSTKKLGDTRDGQAYQVAKLADDNCWMDNLNLIAPNTDLTSSNTNLSTTVTKDTFTGWKKTSGSQTYDAGEFIPVSGTDSTSGTAYGTLYNYYAASAGTIKGGSNSSNATYDICPRGWRLPTGGSSGEFQTLYNSGYNSYAKMRNPISTGSAAFSIAGSFTSGAPTSQGGDGNYWSSTRNSDTTMSVLYLDTSNVYPSNSLNRRYGVSVRCVKKSAAEEIEYLQDMTSALANTLATGATLTLKDKRDENSYTVTKLADGNLWMTQNLRYVGDTGSTSGSMIMKSATSNIDADKTISYTDLTSGNSFAESRIHNSGNTTTGVWYNYAAASAGTITGDSNSTAASQSVCPKNWALPTGNSSGQFGAITSYKSAFSPVAGGFYDLGGVVNTGYGYWWSATASNSTRRYYLRYDGSSLDATDIVNVHRGIGAYVRCILDKPTLYNAVASMSKGTQTAAQLQEAITIPTSASYKEDTSNSGVYEYNSSVFGTASDASNDYKIYYYRGVLENETASYGSNGSAVTYPNYVRLGGADSSSTCWRIVRTTGSGGVKMIYNGLWNSTNSTCANATISAQFSSTSAFDTSAASNGKAIVGVGYTYNANYKSTTSNTTYSNLFGTNSSFGNNTTRSTIKGNIDTWYTSNLSSVYGSHLETNAGYCGDRTLGTSTSWTSPSADSTVIQRPYSTQTSGFTEYFFGAYARTYNSSQKPTLTCSRNSADLYTTSSASAGNKQLTNPIALLTADEANFAGSGPSSGSGVYHANSYLRSGSTFWLLSPNHRNPNGYALMYRLFSDGKLDYDGVGNAYGVRPVISLSQGTAILSGSGTSTDPWEVTW